MKEMIADFVLLLAIVSVFVWLFILSKRTNEIKKEVGKLDPANLTQEFKTATEGIAKWKKDAEEKLSKQMLARLWDYFSSFLETAKQKLKPDEEG